MRMSNTDYSIDTLLIASAVDKLSYLLWIQTEDAKDGRNRPKSILDALMNVKNESDLMKYSTAEEFEEARRRIMES